MLFQSGDHETVPENGMGERLFLHEGYFFVGVG